MAVALLPERLAAPSLLAIPPTQAAWLAYVA